MRREGKVALITGTASGIGRASALRFAEEGARVVAADIAAANHETVELIRAGGGEATAVHADVSDDADMATAVKTAEAAYGSLDLSQIAGIVLLIVSANDILGLRYGAAHRRRQPLLSASIVAVWATTSPRGRYVTLRYVTLTCAAAVAAERHLPRVGGRRGGVGERPAHRARRGSLPPPPPET